MKFTLIYENCSGTRRKRFSFDTFEKLFKTANLLLNNKSNYLIASVASKTEISIVIGNKF